jgi:NADH dehydrogenase
VRDLVERGVDVRVLTRDQHRADHLGPTAVEVARGDVRKPETLPAAVADVDVVVSAMHGFAGPGRVSPKSVDRDGYAHLVTAAEDAGAAVVMVSIVGASPDSSMELFRYKYAAEQHLQSSGVPWTIVRSTAFAELWAELVGTGLVFGRGDNPINLVSVRDVAHVVRDAVLDDALRGRILNVGGPAEVTFNELAAILQEQTGRPARVRHVPRRLLRALAPFHRQPRAGYAMDTTDLTFRPGPDDIVGRTDIRRALAPQDADGSHGGAGPPADPSGTSSSTREAVRE